MLRSSFVVAYCILVSAIYARNCAFEQINNQTTVQKFKDDLKIFKREKKALDFTVKITVPVVWHVINDGTNGILDEAILRTNVELLNKHIGAPTTMDFALIQIKYHTNPTVFTASDFAVHAKFAGDNVIGGQETFNIFSTDFTNTGGLLGVSTFPTKARSEPAKKKSFLFIDYQTMVGLQSYPSYYARFNLGLTLIHEAGHWFGLEHTFSGGCSMEGDGVDDTPAMNSPTFGCPADNSKDTCPGRFGADPIHNFMDYSDDVCYTEFTAGQIYIMRYSYMKVRLR
eukprot:Partr_v1_DN27462_c1_g1_i2_m72079 putative Secreted metalloproteinase that allows assimilation of proteinaceous substrates. Plays a pivotal role as a pathogenicity determinant during infections and contributes to the ability of the pathogen to persist within the mammalian host (By similarity)